jgi:hypothetical protein
LVHWHGDAPFSELTEGAEVSPFVRLVSRFIFDRHDLHSQEWLCYKTLPQLPQNLALVNCGVPQLVQ